MLHPANEQLSSLDNANDFVFSRIYIFTYIYLYIYIYTYIYRFNLYYCELQRIILFKNFYALFAIRKHFLGTQGEWLQPRQCKVSDT